MYKIEKISDSKIELQFEISKEEFEQCWQKTTESLAKEINLKGFRQGNVPPELAKKYISDGDILNEASKMAIYQNLGPAIEKESLEIIHTPEVQIIKVARSSPFEFKATCEIIPEFELKDYKKIKIRKQKIEVVDSEVEKALNELQNMRAVMEKINKPAKFDDVVNIDYKIIVDDKIIENGEGKGAEFVLGKGGFIEGLEKNIEKMNSGENKIINIGMPSNYYQKEMAGKTANIEIRLNEVKERKLPEINDEFAKKTGKFNNLDDLKNNIKQGIAQENEQKEKERIRLEILNELTKNMKLEIPHCLLEDETQKLIADFKNRVQTISHLSFEEYLKRMNKTEEDLLKDFEKEAEKKIKSYLALRKIADKENIKVDEEEISKKADEFLRQYSSIKEAEEKIDIEQLLNYSRNVLLNEKVFEYLESIMVV